MRILFMGKREPQQRDLIARPYGRFFHLPKLLAESGDDVLALLVSHNRSPDTETERDGVHWSALAPGPSLTRTLLELDARARAFRPDWVIGVSDAWYGWLAHRLARRTNARLAIDAYDNYEAYMPWNAPLHWAWRNAVRAADLVTAAGPQLAQRLQSHRHGGAPVEILPMAADPEFVPADKQASRIALGLPIEARLIGYSGGWARNRGTDILLDSFRLLQRSRPDVHLVLSGRPPADVQRAPGVLALGYLDDAQLPTLLNALDVACVITADSAFGRYSYPAKLCEAMACGVPVVATATEPVRWMLGAHTQSLSPVGNPAALAERILSQLEVAHVDYGPLPSWTKIGRQLKNLLSQADVNDLPKV